MEVKESRFKMCADNLLMPENEFSQDIIGKYNNEIQQKRIELATMEIVENLEKLYLEV